jgi:ribosomal protein S8
MALSKSSLKERIVTELQSQGFITSGTHANAQKMAEAIANAVVDEIQANAQAITSMGNAPIE